MSAKIKVIQKLNAKEGKTILEILEKEKIDIKAPCKKGKCGKCLVKIIDGEVSKPTKLEEKLIDKEKLAKGYRLACEAEIKGDITVEIKKNK